MHDTKIKIEFGLDRQTLCFLEKLLGGQLDPEDEANLQNATDDLNAGTAATQAALDDANQP